MAWFLPACGGTSRRRDGPSIATRPTRSWKNAPASARVATTRAITLAIGVSSTPHRVESDASATMMTEAVLSRSNSRVISGLKLVSVDCAQSMAEGRSPGCHSRRPARS